MYGWHPGALLKVSAVSARADQSEGVRQACSCAASVRVLFYPWSRLGVIGPTPAAMGARSLNHWRAREILQGQLLKSLLVCSSWVFCIYLYFLTTPEARGILIPPLGIELAAHAVEAERLSPWTPREVQQFLFFKRLHFKNLSYFKTFFKLKKFNCGDKPSPCGECLTCLTLLPALLFTKILLMPRNQKELLPYFRTKLYYAEKKKRERERIAIKKKKLLKNIEIFKMTKQCPIKYKKRDNCHQ